jgi:branched-chain amino acid transport system permease protein
MSDGGDSAPETAVGGLRRQLRRLDEAQYGFLLKAVVGFGFLALLPTLIHVEVLGFRLGAFLTIQILVLTVVFAYTGQAWNIVSGFTGYFSFGHAAFFGIGAYTTMKLALDFAINPWFGMFVGAAVALVAGLFIGYLNFRYNLKGHYFALATFAFAMLFQVLVRNMVEFGGAIGFYRPFPREYGQDFGIAAMQFENPEPYYYVMLAFLVVVTAVAWAIKRSQLGLYLFAIREDENAAESIGIPTFRYKMLAVGVSAFFTAWAGAFWSMYLEIVRPPTVFGLFRNVEILLPAVVGGLGTISGPIVGAFIIFPLAEFFRTVVDQVPGLNNLVYGLALVLIALLLPDGVLSLRGYFGDEDDE